MKPDAIDVVADEMAHILIIFNWRHASLVVKECELGMGSQSTQN